MSILKRIKFALLIAVFFQFLGCGNDKAREPLNLVTDSNAMKGKEPEYTNYNIESLASSNEIKEMDCYKVISSNDNLINEAYEQTLTSLKEFVKADTVIQPKILHISTDYNKRWFFTIVVTYKNKVNI